MCHQLKQSGQRLKPGTVEAPRKARRDEGSREEGERRRCGGKKRERDMSAREASRSRLLAVGQVASRWAVTRHRPCPAQSPATLHPSHLAQRGLEVPGWGSAGSAGERCPCPSCSSYPCRWGGSAVSLGGWGAGLPPAGTRASTGLSGPAAQTKALQSFCGIGMGGGGINPPVPRVPGSGSRSVA